MPAATGTFRDQIENAVLTALAAWGHLATLSVAIQYLRTRDVSAARTCPRIEAWIVDMEDTAWAANSGHYRTTLEVRVITSQANDASGATCDLYLAYVQEALRASATLTAIQAALASTNTIITSTWRSRKAASPNQAGPSAENPREHVASVTVTFVATYDPT